MVLKNKRFNKQTEKVGNDELPIQSLNMQDED